MLWHALVASFFSVAIIAATQKFCMVNSANKRWFFWMRARGGRKRDGRRTAIRASGRRSALADGKLHYSGRNCIRRAKNSRIASIHNGANSAPCFSSGLLLRRFVDFRSPVKRNRTIRRLFRSDAANFERIARFGVDSGSAATSAPPPPARRARRPRASWRSASRA